MINHGNKLAIILNIDFAIGIPVHELGRASPAYTHYIWIDWHDVWRNLASFEKRKDKKRQQHKQH